jgi:hypothetical protein
VLTAGLAVINLALSIALLLNAVPRLRGCETVDAGTALGAGSTAG